MKRCEWDNEKNQKLIRESGISFEAVVAHIEAGNILAVVPRKDRFKHQKQFILQIKRYIYIVPFVEDETKIFLKTIVPSRALTRKHLLGGNEE